MVELLVLCGNFYFKFKVIYIGGINGKGFIIVFLKNMLEKLGLRVGVFSLFYFIYYIDQISINGEFILEVKLEIFMVDYQFLLEGEVVVNLQGIIEFEIIIVIVYDYFVLE